MSTASSLFTFVLDYDGGNYTSQRRGASVEAALRRWLRKNPCEAAISRKTGRTMAGIPKRAWALISGDLSDDLDRYGKLTRLDGVKNVWCACALVQLRGKERLALLNIIQTEA